LADLIFFRLLDAEPGRLYMIPGKENETPYQTAMPYNEKGFGIFWCPNMNTEADDQGRIAREACRVRDKDINFWYCDIDEGTKKEQWLRIKKSPLRPSLLVETKNGFHMYWKVDKATTENFAIIEKRIIQSFNADRRAKDIVRLLRMWSFNHWKDANDPFLIAIKILNMKRKYTENQMLEAFPPSESELKSLKNNDRDIIRRYAPSEARGDNIYDRIKSMSQKDLLERLSGTLYVNNEVYDIKSTTNGHYNIYVDGKSTSCFINAEGQIIADKNFGHNIINWLKWYNHTPSEIYQILREIVGEAF